MKKTFRKISPHPSRIKEHKVLSKFKLNNPKLWNFNHRTMSRGVAVGLFCAFLPMPMQMVLAAILAIIFSANILISVALVWITNPLTIPPIFFLLYKLGAMILGVEVLVDFEFSLEYIEEVFDTIWQPLLLGSLIVSSISAILGYYLVYAIYHFKHGHKIKR
jgi:uncharacterized protein (DUF2062 family)